MNFFVSVCLCVSAMLVAASQDVPYRRPFKTAFFKPKNFDVSVTVWSNGGEGTEHAVSVSMDTNRVTGDLAYFLIRAGLKLGYVPHECRTFVPAAASVDDALPVVQAHSEPLAECGYTSWSLAMKLIDLETGERLDNLYAVKTGDQFVLVPANDDLVWPAGRPGHAIPLPAVTRVNARLRGVTALAGDHGARLETVTAAGPRAFRVRNFASANEVSQLRTLAQSASSETIDIIEVAKAANVFARRVGCAAGNVACLFNERVDALMHLDQGETDIRGEDWQLVTGPTTDADPKTLGSHDEWNAISGALDGQTETRVFAVVVHSSGDADLVYVAQPVANGVQPTVDPAALESFSCRPPKRGSFVICKWVHARYTFPRGWPLQSHTGARSSDASVESHERAKDPFPNSAAVKNDGRRPTLGSSAYETDPPYNGLRQTGGAGAVDKANEVVTQVGKTVLQWADAATSWFSSFTNQKKEL